MQGGVGRVAEELVRALAAAHPEDELICATTGSAISVLPPKLLELPNVKHVHLKIPNKLWSAACILNRVSFFEQIEQRCGKTDAFLMPNLGFVGCLPKNAPSVLLLHDLSFLIEPRWFTFKQRLWHKAVKAHDLIRKATRLLAVSETTKRDAISLLNLSEEKISVIPLGSTLAEKSLDPSYQLPVTSYPDHFVLALGLDDPRKNSATAIEAVKILRQKNGYEDVALVVVGAPLGGVRAGTKPAPAWLRIIPHPTDTELAALYQNAAAFLYPSWYEGYGLPLHEAARHGTPCVASTAGALPETAPLGTLFANPAKPQHWIEATKLALNQERRIILSQNTWNQAALALHQALTSAS